MSAHAAFRLACLVPALWLMVACEGWGTHRPRSAPPGAPPVAGPIRVMLRDGSSRTLRDVRITVDSITGTETRSGARVAVAQPEVLRVQDRGFSAARTVGALFGVYLAGGLIVLILAGASVPAW